MGERTRVPKSHGYDPQYVVKARGQGRAHLLALDGSAHVVGSRYIGTTLCGLDADDFELQRRGEDVCERCTKAADRIDAEANEKIPVINKEEEDG